MLKGAAQNPGLLKNGSSRTHACAGASRNPPGTHDHLISPTGRIDSEGWIERKRLMKGHQKKYFNALWGFGNYNLHPRTPEASPWSDTPKR
jgi:hypothetical protein